MAFTRLTALGIPGASFGSEQTAIILLVPSATLTLTPLAPEVTRPFSIFPGVTVLQIRTYKPDVVVLNKVIPTNIQPTPTTSAFENPIVNEELVAPVRPVASPIDISTLGTLEGYGIAITKNEDSPLDTPTIGSDFS